MAALENGLGAAQTNAAEAKSSAQTALSSKPYKTGSYTGTGDDKTQAINLGFRPSFVIVTGQKPALSSGDGNLHLYSGMSGGGVLYDCLIIGGSGFSVTQSKISTYPLLNSSGRKYDYIAFK